MTRTQNCTQHYRRPIIANALLSVCVVALLDCTSIRTLGPVTQDDRLDNGVRYFLPTDEVTVSVSVTTTTTYLPKPDLSAREEKEAITRAVTVESKRIADTSRFFLTDLVPNAWASDELGLTLTPTGLLRGVNIVNTGRVGEVVKNLAKFVGTVAAVTGALAKGTEGAAPEWPGPAALCFDLNLDGQPDEFRVYAKLSTEGCLVWQNLDAIRIEISDHEKRIREINAGLDKKKGDAFDSDVKEAKYREERIKTLRGDREILAGAFRAGATEFWKKLGLGEKKKVSSMIASFTAASLPKSPLTFTVDAVKSASNSNPEMLKLIDIGVFVTLDDVSPLPGLASGKSLADCSGTAPQNEKFARLFYRQPLPRLLRSYLKQENGSFAIHDSRLENLMTTADYPRCVTFKGSGNSTRKLSLAFDESGNLTGMSRSATSTAEGVSATMADALANLRDTYDQSLKQLVSIDNSKRTLELSDLQSSIDRLKKEKELLDAGAALSGATATQSLQLQQRQLEAELALLTAQMNLTKATESQPAAQAIEQLKLQVQLLQQQLAVLQAQQALNAAQKP
jgi:hypothetical protein